MVPAMVFPRGHFIVRVEDTHLSLWEGPRYRHTEVGRWPVPAMIGLRVAHSLRRRLLKEGHTCDVLPDTDEWMEAAS